MAASRKRQSSSTSGNVSLLVSTDCEGRFGSLAHSSGFGGSTENVFQLPEKDCYSYDPTQVDATTQDVRDRILPILAHRRNRSGSRSLRDRASLSLSVSSIEGEDFVEELGRYVSEMARTDASADDVWAQLHQKEADLLLAAELGKALLEKNEELSKQQEKLVEQYSKKLEVNTTRELVGDLSLSSAVYVLGLG